MTLLSTISNESINENLKKRFESAEIYVSCLVSCSCIAVLTSLRCRHISLTF